MTEVFITCNFRSKETRRSCCMSWTPCRQNSRSATCHPQGKTILTKEKNILYNTLLFRLQKEKEDAYTDIDRGREKYEKLQVIKLNCTEYFQQVFIFPAISWIVRQSKSPYFWVWLPSVSALIPDINSDTCVTPLWDLTGASEDWQCPTSYFFCFSQCASFSLKGTTYQIIHQIMSMNGELIERAPSLLRAGHGVVVCCHANIMFCLRCKE